MKKSPNAHMIPPQIFLTLAIVPVRPFRDSSTNSKNWRNFCANYRWITILWYPICAASCTVPTNVRPFGMAGNAVHI